MVLLRHYYFNLAISTNFFLSSLYKIFIVPELVLTQLVLHTLVLTILGSIKLVSICLKNELVEKMLQKQPCRGVLRKRCSEKMQQIYRRTPMPKYDFNKLVLQLY